MLPDATVELLRGLRVTSLLRRAGRPALTLNNNRLTTTGCGLQLQLLPDECCRPAALIYSWSPALRSSSMSFYVFASVVSFR